MPLLLGPRVRRPSDISHIYHSWPPCSIRRPRLPGSLDHPGHRRVPACLARLAGKDYLAAFNDIEAVGEIRDVVDIRFGNEYRVAEGADITEPLHDRWHDCRR